MRCGMLPKYALTIIAKNKLNIFAIIVFSLSLIYDHKLLFAENKKDKIVAKINGSKLYLSDIDKARKILSLKAQKFPLEIVYDFLLDDLINRRLIIEAAQKHGIGKEKGIRLKIKEFEENILSQAFMARSINNEVSLDQLKSKYNDYVKLNSGVEEIRARHILVQTREQALEVVKLLKKGSDFADLANKISTGPSKIIGGDLGYFIRDAMVLPFSKAAFSLKKGEINDIPIKTQFGWHIIKVEDKRFKKIQSFEKIKAELMKTIINRREEAFITELRKSAKIQKYPVN